jgi:hypothetical protein
MTFCAIKRYAKKGVSLRISECLTLKGRISTGCITGSKRNAAFSIRLSMI